MGGLTLNTLEFFRSLPLFEGFSDSDLQTISRCCRERDVPRSALIFDAGRPCDGAYIIVQGRVEVTLPLPSGERRQIAVLERGQIFGEICLLKPGKRAMGVGALEDTQVLVLDAAAFETLKAQKDPAAYRLVRAVGVTACERLRSTNHMIEELWGTAPEAAHEDDSGSSAWGRLRRLFGGK